MCSNTLACRRSTLLPWQPTALWLCLGLLAAGGCRSKEQPKLSEETLARIMADLHLAEAATTGLTGYRKDSLLYLYYEQIFTWHGVERQVYENDLQLLARDEAQMRAVVERAEAILQEADEEQ